MAVKTYIPNAIDKGLNIYFLFVTNISQVSLNLLHKRFLFLKEGRLNNLFVNSKTLVFLISWSRYFYFLTNLCHELL